MQTYDAIVLGAGGVGSATMATLARRGLRVLGIDRFRLPHTRGSSHGETRVIRQAYFEHPDYVPLLRRTYQLWRELESRSGKELFQQCGLLEVGPVDGEVVGGVLLATREHGVQVDYLTAAEVANRWPALRVPDGLAAVFEPTAGYLHVERCIETALAEAKQQGAELLVDQQVVDWRADGRCVEVQTTSHRYSAARLVVTAGAWAAEMLGELGLSLRVLRKSLFWYATDGLGDATKLPVFLYELPDGVPYGFPSLDGQRFKVAQHDGGVPLDDPLDVDSAILPIEQRTAERFLQQCLPDVHRRVVDHCTCLYTMTPDGHFVVDRHPGHSNVAYAAGLSGHGFKFAPVLGEALADLVCEGETALPVGFLSTHRFQQQNHAEDAS